MRTTPLTRSRSCHRMGRAAGQIAGFVLAVVGPIATSTSVRADFQNFESPSVHPLEISADGSRLFLAHTADNRLVVFDLTQGAEPVAILEVAAGLEPVTVRQRTATEVWVVNHVSDSINIIDLTTGSIVRTILVGDEPSDVVFAGNPERAFVAVSQEDLVRVYDPANLSLPPVEIPLEMSDPLALTVSADGSAVYVVALDSGNNTTVVDFSDVQSGGGPPPANPPIDPDLPDPPRVGLIVKHDGGAWRDEIGSSWDSFVGYTLVDNDVIEISTGNLTVTDSFRGVGTSLFNIATNPSDGRLYVSNLEANNETRFEPNLQGQFVQNRLTVVDPANGTVSPVHLNSHINYNDPVGNAGERASSLSFPLDLVVSADGDRVYLAAFGSGKVGVFDGEGVLVRRIPVGQGPAGLALAENSNRLYVFNRISSTISTVDLSDDSSTEVPIGFDPTPLEVQIGRGLFYGGENSSAHGDLSCASCHLFGGTDNMSWDLGDPQGSFVENGANGFHPMKGPMTTQTLKGLVGTDPFHWRGDRNALSDFNPAFLSLLGRGSELSAAEFADFEAFVLSLTYPANPNRNLDGSLPDPSTGPNPTDGQQLYLSGNLVGNIQCVTCHTLPTGENGLLIPAQLLQEDQDMVVPQLRNMYEKTRFDNTASANVRGFGYTHDGAVDDLFSFLQFPAFTFRNDAERRDVAAFLLAFDTGTHAAVGAQWTMDETNSGPGLPRVQTLIGVADASGAGLIAKGRDLADQMRGWTYLGSGDWMTDRASEPVANLQAILDLVGPGHEMTFTAVVPGCETRLGVDRDDDGYRDRDELDAGSDPGDPLSTPQTVGVAADYSELRLLLSPLAPNPASSQSRLAYVTPGRGQLTLSIHDVQGRLVRTMVNNSDHQPGRFQRSWDLRTDTGEIAPSGVYFVRLTTAQGQATTRLVIRR